MELLQGAIEFFGCFLEGDASGAPALAIEPRKELEEVEAEDAEKQPHQDRGGLMPGAVGEVIILGEFVKGVVFDAPALVPDGVDDPARGTVERGVHQPAPRASARSARR